MRFKGNRVDRRMKTAAWLRYVAGQVEALDREEAAEGLDDRALADTTLAYHEAQWAGRCCEVGPAGYLCTEPIPHETAHVSTAPNGTEFDRWVTADLPFLAEEQAAGRCAAINEGRRYACSLDLGHLGAHMALAPADEPDAGDEVVDTWIGRSTARSRTTTSGSGRPSSMICRSRTIARVYAGTCSTSTNLVVSQ